MREFLVCLILFVGVAAPLSCVTINNNQTPCGAGGAGGALSVSVPSVGSGGANASSVATAGSGTGGSGGATSSSATVSASSAVSSAASSSTGGPGCPVCSEAVAGNFQSDRLCPASQSKFDALYDCSCASGPCSVDCFIPRANPGDGATCGLTDPAASSACATCIADTTMGCGVLFAACQADTGS